MSKQYSIAEARDRFTTLVRDAERGTAIELTRHGKPVAVLLSVHEYRRLSALQGGFWEAYSAFKKQVNLAELGIEYDTFAGLRDPSPGRELPWQE